MREEFKNAMGTLIFDDEGIRYKSEKDYMSQQCTTNLKNCFCPYGSIVKIGTFLGINIDFLIKGKQYQVMFSPNKEDKKRIKSAVEFAQKAMRSAEKTDAINLDLENEHKIHCNVCGKVYCYTDEDVRLNQLYQKRATQAQKHETVDLLAGSVVVAQLDAQASSNYKNKIVDYDRCPYCGSRDVREMNENE